MSKMKSNPQNTKYQILNTEHAITLLALIITVIVLLILATVSISLIINSGIVDHAQNGVDRYSEEEELEQIKLAVASARLKGNGFLTTENLNSELQERFGEENEVNESTNFYIYKLDKSYRIYKDGKVEEGLLPKEYQHVEYIESTGTQNINTKLIPKATLNGEFEIMRTGKGYPFGSTNGQNKDYWGILFFSKTKTFECYFGTGSYPKVSHWDDNIIYKISIIDKKFYCDGNLLCDFNSINNTYSFNTTKPIYLFGLNYPGGEYGGYRFYKAKFWDEENTLREFIPCYTTTTVTDVDGIERQKDTIGLYDTVEGKFYVNQGTGTFLKGADV